jgi:hypothetical protein
MNSFFPGFSACKRLLTVLVEDLLVARCLHKLHNTDTTQPRSEREIKAHYPSYSLEEDSIHRISALRGNERTNLSLSYKKQPFYQLRTKKNPRQWMARMHRGWEVNIQTDIKERSWNGVHLINLAQDRSR